MPNSRLKIVGDESVTSIDHYDQVYVNLLFDRSIYQPMCTHIGYHYINIYFRYTLVSPV